MSTQLDIAGAPVGKQPGRDWGAGTARADRGRSPMAVGGLTGAQAVSAAAVVVTALGLVLTGHGGWVVVAAAAMLSVLVAYQMPSLTLVFLLAVSIGPVLFQETSFLPSGTFSVGRVPGVALVMLPMAAAVVVRLAVSLSGSRIARSEGRFAAARLLAAVLLVWLGFEVVRNAGAYRLSSVREFAVENLAIVVPVYLATFLRSGRAILRAFKGVAVFALVSPLALIPVIGSLKGWGIGSGDRFYPAVVHLGLAFGVLSLLLLKKYGQLRVGWWVLYVGTFAAAALIIVDGHRSVWLSCATAAAVLVLLGEIRLRRFWHWGFAALGLAAAAALTLSVVGLDVPRYVATRASAFVNPVNDPTSDWRLSIWRQAIPIAREHLIAGQGFGGYYTWLGSGGTSFSVTPHDMYIQMLLKTGMIGVGLAVALGVVALVGLGDGWRVARGRHDTSATPVIVVGIAAVVVTFVWGVVYLPVVYSFIFAGLGLAAAIEVCSQRGESRLPT